MKTSTDKEAKLLSRADLDKAAKMFLSNWLLFLLLPFAAYFISLLVIHRTSETYAAKMQIILKSGEIYDYQNSILQGLGAGNSYQSYTEVESQKKVLRSSNIISEVLDKLNLDVAYYIEGRLKTTEYFSNIPFEIIPYKNDFGKNAYNRFIYINLTDTNSFRLRFERGGEQMEAIYDFDQLILDNGFNFTIRKTRNVNTQSLKVLENINYKFKVIPRNQLIGKYKSAMQIESLDWTNILEITVRDEIVERAERFLDTLAVVFIENSMRTKFEVNRNTQNFIGSQINDVQGILEQIESDLEQFKETKSILNLTKEEEQYFSKMVDYENDITKLDLDLKSVEALEDYILNIGDQALLPPSVYILEGDEYLSQSINKFYSFQIEKNDILFESTEEALSITELERNMDLLRKNLLSYLFNTKTALEKQRRDLEVNVTFYEEKVKRIPKSQREILNIERKMQVNETLYTFLLQKKAETVIAEAGILPETKVIERPSSIGVIAPDKIRIKGFYVLGGGALAFIIAFVRFVWYRKIATLKELQETIDIPVIGGIFWSKDVDKNQNNISIFSDPKSQSSEVFRHVRTNIRFLNPQAKENYVILVSSMMPGEGKTFCASNIAATLAAVGKKNGHRGL